MAHDGDSGEDEGDPDDDPDGGGKVEAELPETEVAVDRLIAQALT